MKNSKDIEISREVVLFLEEYITDIIYNTQINDIYKYMYA